MKYPIDIFDNHVIIVNEEKRLLIDTGSPISISNGNEINIFQTTYKASDKYHGATIDEISGYVGCPLDALIGNNILQEHIFQIDFQNLLFSSWEKVPTEGISTDEFIDVDFNGIPTIKIIVNPVNVLANQNPIESWLDTGAKISYLNKQYVQGLDSVCIKEDFFPGLGKFEVPIYDLPISFNGKEIPFQFGILPQSLELANLSGTTQAIIGADIFSYFSLTFDYADKKIYINHVDD